MGGTGKGLGAYLSLCLRGREVGWGWALIRGWVLIRINTVYGLIMCHVAFQLTLDPQGPSWGQM